MQQKENIAWSMLSSFKTPVKGNETTKFCHSPPMTTRVSFHQGNDSQKRRKSIGFVRMEH